MVLTRYIILLSFMHCCQLVMGQPADSLVNALEQIPGNFYAKAAKKYAAIDKKLSQKTLSYLKRLQRQENKFDKKLSALDSTAGAVNTSAINDRYEEMKGKLAGKASKVNLNQYNAYIDTLSTSLNFLEKYKGIAGKVKLPREALDKLKGQLNQTKKVKEFIAQRKEQMKQVLSKYTKIPAGLQKQYAQISKTAYYYSAQVKEYKELLSDPKKIEEDALSVLSRLPVFQQFMKDNSQLSSLFRMPGSSNGGMQSLAGLQTRVSVQGMIQQRIASGGPNAMAQVKQNLSAAHAEINKLKDKINQLAYGGGDPDMTDFKPNEQKTKPFLKRLEYSADVQFEKSNSLLPSTANIGLGIGYKLNGKNTIGIGGSYRAGMGSLQHINITHQGIGLRSFMDWKAPFDGRMFANIWISGGYEMNYNAAFKNIEQLKDYSAWQRSALIGISKKYKVSKKVKGEMKLLYDFLHRDHVPVSPAVVFRLGYKF